ncbi:hypothetical protein OIDMADRAFT_120387, partial [Oidiodendron maius Zn]
SNGSQHCVSDISPGPRNCIGMNLAWHEMRFILSSVLWHFDITLTDSSFDWLNQKSYKVWDKHPLLIRLQPVGQ